MKYDMYTINRSDIEDFEDQLPEYVLDNCGKRGCFMIGAVDPDENLVGLAQFFIGMLPDGGFVSDVIYVFVDEEYRGNGAASKMISKVHNIMKKSGVDKSIAILGKKQDEKELFKDNGYIFMKLEGDTVNEVKDVHDDIVPSKMEQGVYWISEK